MTTIKKDTAANYSISRGDYKDTADNRINRWYIDGPGPITRHGKGYRTRKLAKQALTAFIDGYDWQQMPMD